LTLGSSFIFANVFGLGLGVLLATTAVFIGACIGATFAFLLGRYLLRDWAKQLTLKYSVFEAIDKALGQKGFRIMALLRLSPIIPFNALNYCAGITAIHLSDYIWAFSAMLPGTVLYVFIGSSAGSLADSENASDNNILRIVTIVLGIVFGVLAVGLASYYAKKELNNKIEQNFETTDENVSQEIP